MKAIKNKLAIAVLAISLTPAVNASDNGLQDNIDSKSTYWGVGIGSVLGAVIGGPPGAALGATLGGSIGWGKDQNDALDNSLSELKKHELALQQHTRLLKEKQQRLQQSEQEIRHLRQKNSTQASRLHTLEKDTAQDSNPEVINSLISHYAQDIYFRSGQSETPEYAQARLASLVELLNKHPDLRVTLKGYTDPTGSAKLNAKLAQARVDGIRELLESQGIEGSRIEGVAIGEVKSVRQQANLHEQLSNQAPITSTPETLAVLNDTQKKLKPTPPVLDRRVSIQLSLMDTEEQTISSLAVLEK